mmetsp:Transcript_5320/g.9757  ORF Transcript_5320/g.9757 Transcript_5320/m.9757 type:complete len:267 (-) Transcript_5320:22-822(-)
MIRRQEGIGSEELLNAFNPIENLIMLNSFKGKQGGKSGAFLYSTHDRKFIIKTISSEEKLLLLNKLLPDYVCRVMSNNTCLVRILGVYMLQSYGNYSTNLMVMEQVGPGLQYNIKYDIKGSKSNRRILLSPNQLMEASLILKDNDFEDMVGSLNLNIADRDRLIRSVEADSLMLARHGIMDYSLLIAKVPCHFDLSRSLKYAYSTTESDDEIVLVAMIDILQQFTISKRVENYWKRMTRCQKNENVSSIEPLMYSKRLVEFCQTIT